MQYIISFNMPAIFADAYHGLYCFLCGLSCHLVETASCPYQNFSSLHQKKNQTYRPSFREQHPSKKFEFWSIKLYVAARLLSLLAIQVLIWVGIENLPINTEYKLPRSITDAYLKFIIHLILRFIKDRFTEAPTWNILACFATSYHLFV